MSLRGPLGPWRPEREARGSTLGVQSPVPYKTEDHPINIEHLEFTMLSEVAECTMISEEIAASLRSSQ